MPKHRKTWNKKKIIEVLVGNCRYCEKEIINTDSFVSFYPKGHAHYVCMRKADDDKTYENEVKT
jgi:hypothetical protein|tara:strand:+ start:294 stop:485 length:192 start_codon:yes stop_codon:yes gene_type:complete